MPDQLRGHVSWETLVFTMPDDGTGSLPILLHIIVNDNKAASGPLHDTQGLMAYCRAPYF
jgi:hypothetical protein